MNHVSMEDPRIPDDSLNRFGDQLAQLTANGLAFPNNVWEIKQEIAGRLHIKPEDFDLWLEALIDLCTAGKSYFEIELQEETLPLKKLGYEKRTREKQCFVHEQPVYGLKIRAVPNENVYRGFRPVAWDQVRDSDDVYIDHFQNGARPQAREKISGPYRVISRSNRYIRSYATGRSFTYAQENLLKREEAAG